jgi:multicomponent Na+:H+ antiporter subunit C
MFEDVSIFLNELFLERLNYVIYVVLLLIGLHAMIAKNNFIKKLIGMSIFQTAIILFYVSIGVKEGATIPIYLPEHDPHGEQAYATGGPEALTVEQVTSYANPLPHVLMLTAIVVGVATLGLALALCQKIYQGYGTVEEDELMAKLEKEDASSRKPKTHPAGKSSSKPEVSSRARRSGTNSVGKTTAPQAKKSSGTRKTKAPVKKATRKSDQKKGDSK